MDIRHFTPGDPRLVEAIVCQLKTQGIFDRFRKECLADVDTKPAFQNLRQRVDVQVKKFLDTKTWKNDLNKNHLRDGVRKSIQDSGILDTGIDAIINQVVNPKIKPLILPYVEETVYTFLKIDKPHRTVTENAGVDLGMPTPIHKSEPAYVVHTPMVYQDLPSHFFKDASNTLMYHTEPPNEKQIENLSMEIERPAEIPFAKQISDADTISSEEEGSFNKIRKESPIAQKDTEIKMDQDNAVDSFGTARGEDENMVNAVQKMSLADDRLFLGLNPDNFERANVSNPIFDQKSLDSISSNSSGLSSTDCTNKNFANRENFNANENISEDSPSTQSTPLIDEKSSVLDSSTDDSKSMKAFAFLSNPPFPKKNSDNVPVVSGASPVSATDSQGSLDFDEKLHSREAKMDKSEGEISSCNSSSNSASKPTFSFAKESSAPKSSDEAVSPFNEATTSHHSKRDRVDNSLKDSKEHGSKHSKDKSERHSKYVQDDHSSHRSKNKKYHRRDKDDDSEKDTKSYRHSHSGSDLTRLSQSSGSKGGSYSDSKDCDKSKSNRHSNSHSRGTRDSSQNRNSSKSRIQSSTSSHRSPTHKSKSSSNSNKDRKRSDKHEHYNHRKNYKEHEHFDSDSNHNIKGKASKNVIKVRDSSKSATCKGSDESVTLKEVATRDDAKKKTGSSVNKLQNAEKHVSKGDDATSERTMSRGYKDTMKEKYTDTGKQDVLGNKIYKNHSKPEVIKKNDVKVGPKTPKRKPDNCVLPDEDDTYTMKHCVNGRNKNFATDNSRKKKNVPKTIIKKALLSEDSSSSDEFLQALKLKKNTICLKSLRVVLDSNLNNQSKGRIVIANVCIPSLTDDNKDDSSDSAEESDFEGFGGPVSASLTSLLETQSSKEEGLDLDFEGFSENSKEITSNIKLINYLKTFSIESSPDITDFFAESPNEVSNTTMTTFAKKDSQTTGKPCKRQLSHSPKPSPKRFRHDKRRTNIDNHKQPILLRPYSLPTPDEDRSSSRDFDVDLTHREPSYSPLSPASESSMELNSNKLMKGDVNIMTEY